MSIKSISFLKIYKQRNKCYTDLHSANQHTKLQVNSSFSKSKMGCFYLQKHTNYDVRFQTRFLLFLGVVRKKQMAPLDS